MFWTRAVRVGLVALAAAALAIGVVALTPLARAEGSSGRASPEARSDSSSSSRPYGYGMGPGMMGGGYGYGMGPGMMGGGYGYGMGSGMMGGGYGYGMGPGMMGGWYGRGMGRGTPGGGPGYGMGPGMMGGGYGMGPIWQLNLTDEQREKISAIADTLRKKHWAIMGQLMDDQAKLRDLYTKSEPDPKAVGAVYGDMSKLRQQMLEAHVQATNQARSVLTPEQKTRLDEWRRQGWDTDDDG